jgi:hypothetical protein
MLPNYGRMFQPQSHSGVNNIRRAISLGFADDSQHSEGPGKENVDANPHLTLAMMPVRQPADKGSIGIA